MHIKSNIAQKIMKPIFIGLYYLDLSKKNTKYSKKINMQLRKIETFKLYLFISDKYTHPKIMKVY